MDRSIKCFKISRFNLIRLFLLDYVKGWAKENSGCGLDSWSSVLDRGSGFPLCLCHHIQTSSGDHPLSSMSASGSNYRGGGLKHSGCETDCSPPVSVEIKNAWYIPSLHHASRGKMVNEV
jgi:hypothetical protein